MSTFISNFLNISLRTLKNAWNKVVSEIENEAELHKYVWFYRSLIDKSVKSFKKMA